MASTTSCEVGPAGLSMRIAPSNAENSCMGNWILRDDDFQVRRNVLKVSGIAGDDASGGTPPGKGCVQRIVNAATHDSALPGFANRRVVIRQRKRLNFQPFGKPQGQFRGDVVGNLVKSGQR